MRFLFLLLLISLFPNSAFALNLDNIEGTYSSNQIGFVHLKSVTLSKDAKGSLKVHAWLTGYPDDVELEDGTAEIYKGNEEKLLVTLKNPRITNLMIMGFTFQPGVLGVHSYLQMKGRPNIHFEDTLVKSQK